MNQQIIKIYNIDDFKKITKGIKVAQYTQVDGSETKGLVNNLEDLTVSDTLSCSFCDTRFENKTEQRLHYKSDWHRFNLKQRLQGLKSVSENNFHLLVENDNSASASDNETDYESNESTTSPKNNVGTRKTEKLKAISEKHKNLKDSKQQNSSDTTDASDFAVTEHTKVFFENEEGSIFSIYRCLLHNRKEVPEFDSEIVSLALKSGRNLLWSIIMIGGGHFAAGVFSGSKPVVHKTYHSYTCRAKQGSMQSSRDNYNASHRPKSAGANLRRSNELHFMQNVQDILESWSSYISSSSLILYRAVGAYNRTILFGGKNAPLDKNDSRLRKLPFPTQKPTFKELKRVQDILSNVEIYGSASNFSSFPQSPIHAKQKKSHENLEKEEKQTGDNLTDKYQSSSTPNTKRTVASPEKPERSRRLINRGKERKSPVRPLPDIVMKLAQSSSESEFDHKDCTDREMNIIEHDLEIDFNAQLQFFDNLLPRTSRRKQNFKQKSKR